MKRRSVLLAALVTVFPTGCGGPVEFDEARGPVIARALDNVWAGRSSDPGSNNKVRDLLEAVQAEASGSADEALRRYRALAERADGTSYASTAWLRIAELDEERREDALAEVFSGTTGWSLGDDGAWSYGDLRRRAATPLVELRSDTLSFRAFGWFRSRSPFPDEYAYLFAILALLVTKLVLTMPLRLRALAQMKQIKALQPEMGTIREQYAGDDEQIAQETQKILRERGCNPVVGCAPFFIEIVFVVWILVTIVDYAPTLLLDNARFWWVEDVTVFDLPLTVAWVLFGVIETLFMPAQLRGTNQRVSMSCSVLMGTSMFGAVAWYYDWPSYVFIFLLLSSALGLIMMLITRAIRKA